MAIEKLYRTDSKLGDRILVPLQINTLDIGGGAERIAWSLHHSYQTKGLQSWLAVGNKLSANPNIFLIPNASGYSRWARFWRKMGDKLTPYVADTRGAWQFQTLLYGVGQPTRWVERQRGYEEFDFPGTNKILDLLPHRPDIVHAHNLHGGYFDLRRLPWLSRRLPVLITLHDAWLLAGHCAHSFDCDRWQSGCGKCPDLTIYPSIIRDGTAHNWSRKKNIYACSRLYIVTPSHWLMSKVKQSMLMPGVQKSQVIPNGVDLSIFSPTAKNIARQELSLPQNTTILLFVASTIRQNIWKDYQTLRNALKWIAEQNASSQLLLLALGEDGPPVEIGSSRIHFIPYNSDEYMIARYYQAADFYLHVAKVDNFPTTILEALACGTPVVATAVGGIPEQIKSLQIPGFNNDGYSHNEATGILVSPADAEQLGGAINFLLQNDFIGQQLGQNAAIDAKQRFSLERMTSDYLNYYQEIIQHWKMNHRAS